MCSVCIGSLIYVEPLISGFTGVCMQCLISGSRYLLVHPLNIHHRYSLDSLDRFGSIPWGGQQKTCLTCFSPNPQPCPNHFSDLDNGSGVRGAAWAIHSMLLTGLNSVWGLKHGVPAVGSSVPCLPCEAQQGVPQSASVWLH